MFTVSGRVTYSEVCACVRVKARPATPVQMFTFTRAHVYLKGVDVKRHDGQIPGEQLPVTVYSFY